MLRREKDKYSFMVCWEAICLWKAQKVVCHYTCNKQTMLMDQPIHGKTRSPEKLIKPHSEYKETILDVREVVLVSLLVTAQGWSCSARSNVSSEWSFSVNYVRLRTEDLCGHPWSPIGGRSVSGFSPEVSELDIWRHLVAWKECFQTWQLWWFY